MTLPGNLRHIFSSEPHTGVSVLAWQGDPLSSFSALLSHCSSRPLVVSFFAGPWWLIADDVRGNFRLWSTPVHRWLMSCIYTPTLSPGIKTSPSSSRREPEATSSVVGVTNGRDANDGSLLANGGKNTSDSLSADPSRVKAAGQDLGSQGKLGKHRTISSGRRLLALFSVFIVSSVVHEAVTFIAMRRTCWPSSNFSLITSAMVITEWDRMFPFQRLISVEVDKGDSGSGSPMRSRSGASGGDGVLSYFLWGHLFL